MINDAKQLYDGKEAFQPYVHADHIPCGVIVTGNSVMDDINALLSSIKSILNTITGGDEVAGSLGVSISYANLTTSNRNDAIALPDGDWGETMNIPNTETPYTWKKTIYTWNVNGLTTPIVTSYEISATALYPETQVMYTAIAAGQTGDLQGPSDYNTTDNGTPDSNQEASGVRWYYFFPGIDASKPEGYIAVRHREAGQQFPNNGAWLISRMAQYPTSNT